MVVGALTVFIALGVLLLAGTRIRSLVAKPTIGPTAQAVAQEVARQHGLSVEFVRAPAFGDACHLETRPPRVALSVATAQSSSPAALAIALHELAHAEEAESFWVRARGALAPLGTISSLVVIPAMLVSLHAAALAFAMSVFVGIIALPSEVSASSRAIEWLRARGVRGAALSDAVACLSWAFSTYLVSFIVAPLQLAQYLLSGVRSQQEPVLAPRYVAALGTWSRSPWLWAAALVVKAVLIAAFLFWNADHGNALAHAMRALRAATHSNSR